MAGSKKDPADISGIQRGRSHRRAMPEAAIKTVCRFIAEDKFIRESTGCDTSVYACARVCETEPRRRGVRAACVPRAMIYITVRPVYILS